MSGHFVLVHDLARQRAIEAVKNAPDGWQVQIKEPKRNTAQNARFWAQLGDIATQVEWYGRKLSPDSWKHIFSSSLKKQDVVPSLDGSGFVVLGVSTSNMSKREFADLIDLMTAFGNERGVEWSDPAEVRRVA